MDTPTYETAKPGEYYVCQDWDHERWFQVRQELDNGERAGRLSMQISGQLSKENADYVALALNSHKDLLEALLYLLDALPFGARGKPGSRMDRAITASAEAITKARGEPKIQVDKK